MKHVERYAVASRSKEKAETFAGEWQFTKAYGSYEELIKDPHVDLIYIATPHSEHYEHARLCILNQKPVLCEKAFTANARQAEDLLNLAKEHQVFITEAIWTRYMPLSQKIRELIEQGAIGKPFMEKFLECQPRRFFDVLQIELFFRNHELKAKKKAHKRRRYSKTHLQSGGSRNVGAFNSYLQWSVSSVYEP